MTDAILYRFGALRAIHLFATGKTGHILMLDAYALIVGSANVGELRVICNRFKGKRIKRALNFKQATHSSSVVTATLLNSFTRIRKYSKEYQEKMYAFRLAR